MQFEFRPRKAAQAADYLLRLGKGEMNYVKLIKLLYMADRKSLVETGKTITGDRMVAMNNGPVLSSIYDAIKGRVVVWSRTWKEYVAPAQDFRVRVRKEEAAPLTAYDELSRYDIRVLTEIHVEYGKYPTWQLVRVLHGQLPEWTYPRGSSRVIDPADILRACGWSPAAIERATQESQSDLLLEQLGTIV